MTSQEFTAAIYLVSIENVKNALLKAYQDPPGRKPHGSLVEISNWIKTLDSNGKKMISNIISDAAELSAFNFLSVIDGVVSIDSGTDKGELDLWYNKNGQRDLINDPKNEYLHDLLPKSK